MHSTGNAQLWPVPAYGGMNTIQESVATTLDLKFSPPRSCYQMHTVYRVPKSKHAARVAGLNLPVARGMRVISRLGEEFCSIPRKRLAELCGAREVDFVPRSQTRNA
jgi:hypothetical protein